MYDGGPFGMDEFKKSLWDVFLETGDINDYLRYRQTKKNDLNFEAGEDFGFDKNDWDSDQDH